MTILISGNYSGATTGVKVSYQTNVAMQVLLIGVLFLSGAPTVQIRITRSGQTVRIFRQITGTLASGPFPALNPGDLVDVNVSTAVAGSSFNVEIWGD